MRDGQLSEWGFWFGKTHDVEAIGMGGAVWRLRRLPQSGGLDQQDAKLMAALDHYRSVANELLAKRQAAASAEDELKQFHARETRDTVH